MLARAISTVSTPAFRLLLFCFTAARSSVMVSPSPAVSLPSPMPVIADRLERLHLHQACPQTAETLPASSASGPAPANWLPACTRRPGTRSSTSSSTPKSRLNSGAILMCDAGKLLHAQLAFDQPLRKPFCSGRDLRPSTVLGPPRSFPATRARTRSLPVRRVRHPPRPAHARRPLVCAAVRISSSFAAIRSTARAACKPHSDLELPVEISGRCPGEICTK